MLFSERIRILRQEQGVRQRTLADAIGVDVPMFSRYEHGERHPKREQVIKLAKLLKADADELVALWLAEDAMNAIGHDKMSMRAAELLRNTLDGEDVNKPAVAPQTNAPVASTTNEVANIDADILKAPEAPSSARTLVASIGSNKMPQYHCGDARQLMATIEDRSIDCIVTTPPYWHLRQYKADGITIEDENDFINDLLRVTAEAWRALKDGGSLWLNLCDSYDAKGMQALPWRIAIKMMDLQGWSMRNDIVWNKQQGTIDNTQNHVRNTHEYFFHFVKGKDYYYNDAELRSCFNREIDRAAIVRNNERYNRNIASNDTLTQSEKRNAMMALQSATRKYNEGLIGNYRLYLREKDMTASGDEKLDKAIKEQGFYIQESANSTSMPGDVWNIVAERAESDRYVIAPQLLYKLAIVATCPRNGIVLDPYCGTGTACKVAYELGRQSIGFDKNEERLRTARGRVEQQSLSLF